MDRAGAASAGGASHATLTGGQIREREKRESADKPGSVEGNHPSGARVAARLERPTGNSRGRGCGPCGPRVSLFGLAPGGVCRAAECCHRPVRSYRTLSPLPACCSPWRRTADIGGLLSVALSVGSRPQALPGTLPCGARLSSAIVAAVAWPTPAAIIRAAAHRAAGAAPAPGRRARGAHPGDLRGELRGLGRRQFLQQDPEQPPSIGRVPGGFRLVACTTITISPRAMSASAAHERSSVARVPRYTVSWRLVSSRATRRVAIRPSPRRGPRATLPAGAAPRRTPACAARRRAVRAHAGAR